MFSQTTEYALRAAVCLAYTPERLTPTPELARMTKVPPNYLAKVLQMLSAADLIIGRRGVGGGYRLARMPEKISMLDVINAIAPVNRIDQCPLGLSNHGKQLCALHRCLDIAADSMIQLYSSMTLDLIVRDNDGSHLPLCDFAMTAKMSRNNRVTSGGKTVLNHTIKHPGN
jgi:Rrf2 family transcriptional regulator, nitric oxide-sensitive transcriptional repressor